MLRPIAPDASDCCGSGCCPCVWDTYYERLAAFDAHVASGAAVLEHSAEDAAAVLDAAAGGASENTGPRTYSVTWRYAAQATSDDKPIERLAHAAGFMGPVLPLLADRSPVASSASLRLASLSAGANSLEGITAGSSIGVLAPNAEEDARWLCERLGLARCDDSPDEFAPVELFSSPFAAPKSFPPWLPQSSPLRATALFTHFVDMNSAAWATPSFFGMLADAAKDAAEATELRRVAALPWPEFKHHVVGPHPTLRSTLAAYPTCKPSLARLLEHSTPLRSRIFSVAGVSRSSCGGTAVDVCFRPVRATLDPSIRGAEFLGHVTTALQGHDALESPAIPHGGLWWRRRVGHSTFPSPVLRGEVPTVVLAAGSGIAPFRMLLQQRQALRAAAPLTLLWTCRDAGDAAVLSDLLARSDDENLRAHVTLTRAALSATSASAFPAATLHASLAHGLEAVSAAVWGALKPGAAGVAMWCGPTGFNHFIRGRIPLMLNDGAQLSTGEAVDVALRGITAEEYCDALGSSGRLWWENWTEHGCTELGLNTPL
jgi:sulfite reductase alpha subunit-like flavoprotein